MEKRMKQFRVTKYNPIFRDKNGAYQKDDWTDYSDVGKCFSGYVLTAEEYYRVENNYIMMCIDVWERQGCPTVHVENVENDCFMDVPKTLNDKAELSRIIKGILENQFWAKLVGNNFFIHFGWDFYMYIGTKLEQSVMSNLALSHHLFCDVMDSPYSEN